jgi:hypothetical protein
MEQMLRDMLFMVVHEVVQEHIDNKKPLMDTMIESHERNRERYQHLYNQLTKI